MNKHGNIQTFDSSVKVRFTLLLRNVKYPGVADLSPILTSTICVGGIA